MIHEIQIYLHQEKITPHSIFKWYWDPGGWLSRLIQQAPRSHVCTASPDVGYCMLSESITSLSLMAAWRSVSFFCLVVVKCRSKHKGERKLIIAFDTCCEAEQLFVGEGQLLLSFFKPQWIYLSNLHLSNKLSFQKFRGSVTFFFNPENTNLWHVFL